MPDTGHVAAPRSEGVSRLACAESPPELGACARRRSARRFVVGPSPAVHLPSKCHDGDRNPRRIRSRGPRATAATALGPPRRRRAGPEPVLSLRSAKPWTLAVAVASLELGNFVASPQPASDDQLAARRRRGHEFWRACCSPPGSQSAGGCGDPREDAHPCPLVGLAAVALVLEVAGRRRRGPLPPLGQVLRACDQPARIGLFSCGRGSAGTSSPADVCVPPTSTSRSMPRPLRCPGRRHKPGTVASCAGDQVPRTVERLDRQ